MKRLESLNMFPTGSFRDPAGRVFDLDGRIYRLITGKGADAYTLLMNSEFIQELVANQKLVAFKEISKTSLDSYFPTGTIDHLLEHERLGFISYPYEWSFSALKCAALFHLDIQIDALKSDITLIDASAFNIQFNGPNPIFIDHLSFRTYQDGDLWMGHNQFCEQFLNPLLFQVFKGIPFNEWYRGKMSGLATSEIAALLPAKSYLDINVLIHMILPNFFEKRHRRKLNKESTNIMKQPNLPKHAFLSMLQRLRRWVASLEAPQSNASKTSDWVNYASTNSYSIPETEFKTQFVADFASKVRPNMVWDLGCNSGKYSSVMLSNGANSVIGFDSDPATVDAAFRFAQSEQLNFLPLYQDLTNPSSDQGWRQTERQGFLTRRNADAVLSLALIHHLVIGNNIPLDDAVSWIIDCAPNGIIEFVPRGDPMIERMLGHREDIIDDYSEAAFLSAIELNARIVKKYPVSNDGRVLVWYDREN